MKNAKGYGSCEIFPVGTVRIRTRHKRNKEQRYFIKISTHNVWVLLSRHVWEKANGLIPMGMSVHHKDGNKLNDTLSNLELVSKADHILIHKKEFEEKRIAASVAARRSQRWSTKSVTKRTGRHPKNCDCPLHCHQNK